MKIRYLAAILILFLAACAAEPQQVEVTRIVNEQVPVTVEVTRVVEVASVVEVPVEVTRIVEVVVTPTVVEETAVATPTPEPSPTAAADAAGSIYVVQPGDSLSRIAEQTGTTVDDLRAANGFTADSVLIAGRELFVPGWTGGVVASAEVIAAAATAVASASTSETVSEVPAAVAATAVPPQQASIQGPNLLPNPSFEGDWYFYLYNELQIPEGWQLTTDEGTNSLPGGAGGLFNRPEVRVVPSSDLPPSEHSLFIFDGRKTVKAFKGGAPTSFSLFTDVALQPGTYRLQVAFFPDTVLAYSDGQKTFSPDPLAAEARIIVDSGGTDWQGTQSGQRNVLTYDFTVDEARTVRVGASFRNRYIMANNGWFLDSWSLHALSTP